MATGPFRAYFFSATTVAWIDDDGAGTRLTGASTLTALWPDLVNMPTPAFAEKPHVERAYAVTADVLRLSQSTSGGEWWAYIDVRRSRQVPQPPRADTIGGARQVISYGPGPVHLVIPFGEEPHLRDLRTGLRGPTGPAPWDGSKPIVLIPGEPARQVWNSQPPKIETLESPDLVPVSAAFPGIDLPRIDTTAVMFGNFQVPATAQRTSAIDDAAIERLRLITTPMVQGHDVLAVLDVLSGLSPVAHHPDGHFGIAHLTADQLAAGGWAEPPEAILAAGGRQQIEVLCDYLASIEENLRSTPGQLLALLATGQPILGEPAIPAPIPNRLAGLAPAGVDAAGGLMLGDLDRRVAEVLTARVRREFAGRFDHTPVA